MWYTDILLLSSSFLCVFIQIAHVFQTKLVDSLNLWSFLSKKINMFFLVYKVIEWSYYKQEGELQVDGTEEVAS